MRQTLRSMARAARVAACMILTAGLIGEAGAQTPVTIGDPMSTTFGYVLPVNNLYNYSYTQQILLSTAIGMNGDITKIRFKHNSGTLALNDDWTVYLGYKSANSYSSTTDWVPFADLTQVFSGTVTVTGGWIDLTLTTPFNYDMANGNLVIAVDENSFDYEYDEYMFPTNASGADYRALHYRSDATNPDPASPPTATGRLSYYNTIQLEISGPPCSGTPTAGLASTTAAACAGVPFTLNATPSGNSGLTFLYEVSTDGGVTWNELTPSSTLSSFTVNSQTVASQYRVTVACSGGTPSVSAPISVSQNVATDCFCTPVTSGGASSYITNFMTTGGITNIDKTSAGSTSGYADYHATDSASAMPGTAIGYSMTVNSSTYGRAIWIDYNEDGQFQPGERVAGTTSYVGGSWTGSFTIPAGTAPGPKRMRILAALSISNPTNPCLASGSSGEYEDYTFVVEPLPSCSGAPAPGATYASNTTTCFGNAVQLGVENHPLVTGLSYAWYESTDGGATWTAVSGAGDSTYTATPMVNTMYRALATCATGGDTASSTPVSIGFYANIDSVTEAGICAGGMATLTATAAAGTTINWYDMAEGGSVLDTGAEFTTPALSTTTSYYAEPVVAGPAEVTIGAGASISNSGSPGYTGQSPFTYHYGNYKHQMLVLGSELAAAGMVPGTLSSLSFVVTGPSSGTTYGTFNNFSVSVKQSSATELNSTFETGTTEVWTGNFTPTTGVNTFTFTTPFVWDGASNLIIQTCYHNDNSGAVSESAEVEVDATSFPSHNIYRKDGTTPDICGITTGGGGLDGPVINNRPKMIFGSTGSCSGPRVPVTVTVSAPDAGTIVADETAMPDIDFSTTGTTGAANYSWDFGDGATAATLMVSHTYTANGTYTVSFMATDTCGNTDTATTTVVISGVGIPAASFRSGQVSVYPNPASNLTVVEAKGATIKTLEVVDNLGRVVLRNQPNTENAVIDVKGMAQGIYTLRVQTDKGLNTVKLVVKE